MVSEEKRSEEESFFFMNLHSLYAFVVREANGNTVCLIVLAYVLKRFSAAFNGQQLEV